MANKPKLLTVMIKPEQKGEVQVAAGWYNRRFKPGETYEVDETEWTHFLANTGYFAVVPKKYRPEKPAPEAAAGDKEE